MDGSLKIALVVGITLAVNTWLVIGAIRQDRWERLRHRELALFLGDWMAELSRRNRPPKSQW